MCEGGGGNGGARHIWGRYLTGSVFSAQTVGSVGHSFKKVGERVNKQVMVGREEGI